MVDYVVVFQEVSAGLLIAHIKPNVHCKGTDYSQSSVPEAAIVESYGGRVAIVGDPKDHSTSELISRLKR
jgi:bifunctional ADP-heptose synthase (sugar kinase/adenylyltransferase)